MMSFVSGFLLGFSLILAIGAQNAFVLRQGLAREHVFAVCLCCALSDVVLITAGVLGFGALLKTEPLLGTVLRYAGALFLLGYAFTSAQSAFRGTNALAPADTATPSLKRILGICLALTWLNPHVYVDTLLLLGSISTQFPGHQWAFGAGAALASFVFFFSLGYGARLLRPILATAVAWRMLDAAIALLMTLLALHLALSD